MKAIKLITDIKTNKQWIVFEDGHKELVVGWKVET